MQVTSDERVNTRTRAVSFSAEQLREALVEFVLDQLNIDPTPGHVSAVVDFNVTEDFRVTAASVTVTEHYSKLPVPAPAVCAPAPSWPPVVPTREGASF